MTLQQMRYAIMIADCGSMNEAAHKLFITQPSLSSTIKELEKELGTPIFVRSNRGITITQEGLEFLGYARQIIDQYGILEERFIDRTSRKTKFSISTQHYSFAVKAFIETVNEFGMDNYEFAIHETQTHTVMNHVRNMKSELTAHGFVWSTNLSGIKRGDILLVLFREYGLEFNPLFACSVCVYLWKNHPLADREDISIEELRPYPCLSFEQGDNSSFYFAEEVLSTYDYRKIIKADDRATLLNLMVGMNAFTLCSGIITEDLNGSDYIAVPLAGDNRMTIGYIKKARVELTDLGRDYINQLKIIGQKSGDGVVMLSEPPLSEPR